jgi:trimethylamine--corrinoid protein Co-methyltransferase
METEYIYPKVGNRMSPKEWEEAGRPGLMDRAIARTDAILASAPCQIPPDVDRAVRAAYNIRF